MFEGRRTTKISRLRRSQMGGLLNRPFRLATVAQESGKVVLLARCADTSYYADCMSKLLILAAVIAMFVVGCGSGYVKRTEQFATRVKAVVKPDELQAWATNIIAKTPLSTTTTLVNVQEAEIPNFIQAIYGEYPEDVEVQSSDSGPCVVVCYGSGNGHWGLYVGSSTFHQQSDKNFYVLEWKPGIYFWDGP